MSCGWFSDLWDALSAIGIGYLLAGWTLQTVQTTLTAFGWYSILRAAFPRGRVAYLQILAAYAAGVALNGFLPANIGTVVMLLMFVAIIPGANLPGVLGGMVVQKIFFTVAGAFVYVYLFALGAGVARPPAARAHDHPVLVARDRRRRRDAAGRSSAGSSGASSRGCGPRPSRAARSSPAAATTLLKVALPSFGAWLAKLGVIAVFLTGYGITVTFHTVMSVMGGNSIANTVSVTPGGVGVNQAANVAALSDVTDAATATAYSLGQQLAITAWNIAFAVVLVDLGVRLDRRQAARRAVLHRRQGQGRASRRPSGRRPRRPSALVRDVDDDPRRAGEPEDAEARLAAQAQPERDDALEVAGELELAEVASTAGS